MIWRNGRAGGTPITAQALNELRAVELGYAELTSNFSGGDDGGSGNAAAALTEYDIPGLSLTVMVTDRPIVVDFFGQLQKRVNAGNLFVYLREGSTLLATGGGTLGVDGYLNGLARARLAPAAGEHTYKVSYIVSTVGGRIQASAAGGATGPAFISVTEV